MLISSVKRSQMFVLVVVLQHPALNPTMVYTWAAAGIHLYGSLKMG